VVVLDAERDQVGEALLAIEVALAADGASVGEGEDAVNALLQQVLLQVVERLLPTALALKCGEISRSHTSRCSTHRHRLADRHEDQFSVALLHFDQLDDDCTDGLALAI